MTSRVFWFGAGCGIIVTSLLLGLTSSHAGLATTAITDDQLGKLAEERGYHLVSDREYDRLTEKREKTEKDERQDTPRPPTVYLYVPRGFTWQEVADVLTKAHIVEQRDVLMEPLRKMGRERRLRPGLYTIEAGDSAEDIVEKLSHPGE